jgi:hypothetical protein
MMQQKFIVQVTTLPDCDDITRFDGIPVFHCSSFILEQHMVYNHMSLVIYGNLVFFMGAWVFLW